MKKIEIYVLTHKEFDETYDSKLYKPLLNGSYFNSENLNYIRDDTGDNISKLNPFYAELTGEYWVWKNSKADIIGFNHYRRWFVKNIKLNKLNKDDILNDLETYDIILPQKTRFLFSIEETIKKSLKRNPDYGVHWDDEIKLKKIIDTHFKEYRDTYEEVMNGNECYNYNMFICNKELADEYFKWAFNVIDLFKNEIDFSKYPENNKRVFGFISERLLTTFVLKNNLKIKEHYVHFTERRISIPLILKHKFPQKGYGIARIILSKLI